MAAVVVAVMGHQLHGNRHHQGHHASEEHPGRHQPHGSEVEQRAQHRHAFFDRGGSVKLGEEELQERAARRIQTAALKRLVDPGVKLRRVTVIERLELEKALQRDLRLLNLCLLMFAAVVAACMTESAGPARLGLLQTYKQMFYLDDSLSEIKTMEQLHEYLQTVSGQARALQPLSDYYFAEPGGEIRVFEGIAEFDKPLTMNIRDLKPKIDTPEWTMTAWVQLENGGGGYVIRKPLGQTPETKLLSCWAWYVGWPQDAFEYGVHDYRGGSDAEDIMERIMANNTSADDGAMHFLALVVKLDAKAAPTVQFWVDARMTFESALPREVTDCTWH